MPGLRFPPEVLILFKNTKYIDTSVYLVIKERFEFNFAVYYVLESFDDNLKDFDFWSFI